MAESPNHLMALIQALEQRASPDELIGYCLPLVSAQALANSVSKAGQTALHVALQYGHQPSVIAAILAAAPDAAKVQDSNGMTPLHLSLYKDHPSETISSICPRRPRAVKRH
jgi:ankyrin repeat protein